MSDDTDARGGYGAYGGGSTGGFGGGYNTGSSLSGAPDVGTIGGTFRDDNGDNSTNMGGLSSGQSFANEGVNSNPYGYNFGSAGYTDPGSFQLGSLFGNTSGTGLPTNPGETSDNTGSTGFTGFVNSPFGKLVRGLVSMHPLGRIANLGVNLATGANPISAALGMVPGAGGLAARTAYGVATSNNPGGVIGSTGGGMLGSTGGGMLGNSIGGPVGGVLGSMLGGMFGSKYGGQLGTQAGQSGADNSPGLAGSLATGLAGLYSGYQAQKQAGANAGAVNSQIQNLSSMYSPNGAYATQLRQELSRRDAASGRNSQYGPREAQLQALLADKANTTARTIGDLSSQAQTANTAQQTARAQALGQLLKLGQQSGLGGYLQNLLPSFNQQPQLQQDYTNGGAYTYGLGR